MTGGKARIRGSRQAGFGSYTAISVVVANMVGAGVFTSLGFQLEELRSPFALLMLWVVGGIAALCGALTYAELGAAIRRSGGEYVFLSHLYHPAAGFVSGWVSATIGFSAPVSLAAITFGTYLASVFPALSPTWLAVGLVLLLTVVHSSTRRTSGGFQRWSTTTKIVLIGAFCAAGLLFASEPQEVRIIPAAADFSTMFTGAFAVSLIFVSYAYSGWNAATYLTAELRDPRRILPRALVVGTVLVMSLYLGLNYVFLFAAPVEEMAGQLEVGYIAAGHIFGEIGAAVMGITMSLLLVSTVSAMVLAGPRVLHAIGEDYALFRFLGKVDEQGIPRIAIWTQAAISLAFILTGSFETIVVFSGFTMGLNTLLAAAGIFVLRYRRNRHRSDGRSSVGHHHAGHRSDSHHRAEERSYRAWGYPVTPVIFLAITGWTLAHILLNRPLEAGLGAGLILFGFALYHVARRRDIRQRSLESGA